MPVRSTGVSGRGWGVPAVGLCVALALPACSGGSSRVDAGPSGGTTGGPLSGGTTRDAPVGRRVAVPQVALPSGPVSEIPASVRGDCSVDVSDALNQWLASVSDNATARLGARRCYLISAPVTVAGRVRLALDGNGATLQSTPARVEATDAG